MHIIFVTIFVQVVIYIHHHNFALLIANQALTWTTLLPVLFFIISQEVLCNPLAT